MKVELSIHGYLCAFHVSSSAASMLLQIESAGEFFDRERFEEIVSELEGQLKQQRELFASYEKIRDAFEYDTSLSDIKNIALLREKHPGLGLHIARQIVLSKQR